MGNLADHRRLREEQGLYKEDPGTGTITKNELNYIPFLGKNPTKEKPAVYSAKFNVTDGVIELEAKRSGGRLRLTCEANDEHNRAIFECVERFVKAIYDGTARRVTTPTEDELSKVKEERNVIEAELKKANETIDAIRQLDLFRKR